MPLFNNDLTRPLKSTATGSSTRRAISSSAGSILFGCALISVLLTGCSKADPAARKNTLEKFCTSVATHILDRNPATITESLNTLYHEELSDAARQKLEDAKVIPDSPITVLRWKDDWSKGHKSNRVDVGIVRAVTPMEAKDVTFKVSGKDWDLVDGKQTDFHPFQFTIVAELTPDMDGMARALDIQGLGAPGAKSAASSDSKDDASKSSSKRKRRR